MIAVIVTLLYILIAFFIYGILDESGWDDIEAPIGATFWIGIIPAVLAIRYGRMFVR